MPFLFPGLLALTALAAVPVIIHLLNRQRYRPVRWAAMNFLLSSIRQDAKKIQYRDMLLMLLRALACLLLVVSICRPLTRFVSGEKGEERAVILVIDTSLSMGATTGSSSLLDRAKEEAVGLVRGLEPGTGIGLIDGSAPAAVIIPRTEDAASVESAIEELVPTDGMTDIVGAIRTAASLAGEAGFRSGIDLVFVTDLQAVTWRRESKEAAELMAGMERDIEAYVVSVADETLSNLSITDIRADTPWVTQGQPAAVRVDVANGGAFPADNIVVDMLVDGQKVSSQTVASLEPGKADTVSYVVEVPELGRHVLAAVVNGARGRVPADDTRRAVLEVNAGVKVLLVDGEPGARFGDGEIDYIEALLNPHVGASSSAALSDADDTRAGFAVTRVTFEELTPLVTRGQSVIVLANVPSIDVPMASSLHAQVSDGAGLIIFLGDQVVPENYNQFFEPTALGASGEESDRGIMPAVIGRIIDRSESDRPLYLSSEHLGHPWMSLFRFARNTQLLRSAVLKAYELSVKGRDDVRVVAYYGTGVPAIVERGVGRGRVVLVGTTADPEWNELFHEPLGPVLVRRIVSDLMPGSAIARVKSVGETVEIPLRPEERSASLKLMRPDGRIQEVRAESVGDRLVFAFLGRDLSGVYRLEIQSLQPREEVFILNTPPAESDLRPLRGAELGELFPEDSIGLLAGRGSFGADESLSRARVGRELWWPVLLACLVLFVAEIVLARIFTPEPATEADLPAIARQAMRAAMGNRPVTGGRRRR